MATRGSFKCWGASLCQLGDFGGLAILLPRLEHPLGHFIFLPEFPGILADDGR